MPPLWVFVLLELAVQELEIPEVPPAVVQPCFWFESIGVLTPVLFVFFVMVVVSCADAMRPFPIAIMLTAITATIAAIATSIVFWFFTFVIL
jgi:hypothetical protein